MRPMSVRLLTTLAGLFLLAGAFAQRHPIWSSVEAYVSGVDTVYYGSVTAVGPLEAQRNDGVIPFELEVAVKEVLKGEKVKSFKVLQYTWKGGQEREKWLALKGKGTLWFIGPDKVGERFVGAHTLPVEPYPKDMYSEGWGNLTMDFQVLRSGQATLDHARAFVREFNGRSKSSVGLMFIPRLSGRQVENHIAAGELIVPVCPRLESIARRMIKSPQTILPSREAVPHLSRSQYDEFWAIDIGTLKRMGVQCIESFKSKDNIDMLRGLLQDPFIEADFKNDFRSQVYSVRRTAYEVLTKWGVKVAKPNWMVGEDPAIWLNPS